MTISSPYCEKCRTRRRRQGDVLQKPILKRHLKPYIREVEQALKKGNLSKIETALTEIHALLLDHMNTILSTESKTGWINVYEMRAAEELARVFTDVSPWECGVVMAAMFVLREREPRRFVSDNGFIWQCVRAFRSRASLAYGSYWSEKRNKAVKAYRDLPSRVVAQCGSFLIEGYSNFGAYTVRAVRRQFVRPQQVRAALAEGFAELK
jgi:hypothetical protein